MADAKAEHRANVQKTALTAADAAAAKARVLPEALGDLRAQVEKVAGTLFDQFMAGAEKKGEPVEKAAPKVARIVAGRVEREAAKLAAKAPRAEPEPEPEPEPQPQAAGDAPALGRVGGKTSGVNRKILNVLNAVSAHYDEPLQVISGKREPRKVATAIFMQWNSNLRQGKALPYLQKNERLRSRLDTLKQDKDRSGFESHLQSKADMDQLSPHMTGDAADLPTTTPDHVIEAIATCLSYKAEKNTEGTRCHHFGVEKVVWPIPNSVRERWPEAPAD